MPEKKNPVASEANGYAFVSVFRTLEDLRYRARIADATGDARSASEYRAYVRMLDDLLADIEARNQRAEEAHTGDMSPAPIA
jgi:hypothetical protein